MESEIIETTMKEYTEETTKKISNHKIRNYWQIF